MPAGRRPAGGSSRRRAARAGSVAGRSAAAAEDPVARPPARAPGRSAPLSCRGPSHRVAHGAEREAGLPEAHVAVAQHDERLGSRRERGGRIQRTVDRRGAVARGEGARAVAQGRLREEDPRGHEREQQASQSRQRVPDRPVRGVAASRAGAASARPPAAKNQNVTTGISQCQSIPACRAQATPAPNSAPPTTRSGPRAREAKPARMSRIAPEHEHEADHAQLTEDLGVQRVGILDLVCDRPVALPLQCVGSGSATAQGLTCERIQGNAPLLEPPVVARVNEAAAQVVVRPSDGVAFDKPVVLTADRIGCAQRHGGRHADRRQRPHRRPRHRGAAQSRGQHDALHSAGRAPAARSGGSPPTPRPAL